MNAFRRALFAPSRRLQSDQSGVTLAELIVTIALMAMLLTLIMTIFVTFTRSFAEDRSASTNTAAATVAMNELTRVIRAGTENPVTTSATNQPVFSYASAERVKLQAYLDTEAASPKPVQVQFVVNSDRTLVETRWDAKPLGSGYFSFKTTVASERTIVRQIATGSTPVFSFYNAKNELIPLTAGKVPDNLLPNIAAVKISMTVQTDPTGKAQTATLENTVGIPNLGLSRIGSNK